MSASKCLCWSGSGQTTAHAGAQRADGSRQTLSSGLEDDALVGEQLGLQVAAEAELAHSPRCWAPPGGREPAAARGCGPWPCPRRGRPWAGPRSRPAPRRCGPRRGGCGRWPSGLPGGTASATTGRRECRCGRWRGPRSPGPRAWDRGRDQARHPRPPRRACSRRNGLDRARGRPARSEDPTPTRSSAPRTRAPAGLSALNHKCVWPASSGTSSCSCVGFSVGLSTVSRFGLMGAVSVLPRSNYIDEGSIRR